MGTVFEPIRPVPPMTTIFILPVRSAVVAPHRRYDGTSENSEPSPPPWSDTREWHHAASAATFGQEPRRAGVPRRRSFAPARAMSRARCLRPIAAAEDQYLEPFGSSHSVTSGAGFWREPIADRDVCAIPIVREVVPTGVNIRVRGTRPSAVRERRSWAIGGRRTCRHSCSSASRFYAATATLPCRSKPSRWAWRGPGLGALVIAIPRTRRLTDGGLVRRRAAHRGHRRLVRRRDRARRAGGVADRRRPRRRGSPAVVGRAAGRVSRLIEADMGTGRMEAFSDGVIAIIITIMVLELKVPHGTDLAALGDLLPELANYVLSFVYVAIYWNNHHHLLHACDRINGAIMWANMHFLFWLSLIPFVTSWVGEHREAPVPAAAYGVVLLMAGVAYLVMERQMVRENGPQSVLAETVGRDRKGLVSLIGYVAAIALAFVSPR